MGIKYNAVFNDSRKWCCLNQKVKMHIRGVDFVPTRRVGETYPYISLMSLSEEAEGS